MNAVAEVDLGLVDHIVTKFEQARREEGGRITGDDLIALLQQTQAAYGYLPRPAMMRLSERTGIPASRIYGVITFYGQFYIEPHGKHTITVCRGTACHVRGGKKVLQTVKSLLHIEDGETSEDMLFSLETVACLGVCALSPVMVLDGDYYGKLTPRRAELIVKQLLRAETQKES